MEIKQNLHKKFVRIAHLSDLHFSSSCGAETKYRSVETALINLKPDVIVVTGDIADNIEISLKDSALDKSFQNAKSYLETICSNCGVKKNNLFVVPGNHDFRYAGFLKKKGNKQIFLAHFSDYTNSKFIEEINLVVGCFDSNTTDYKMNFATGKVLKDEFDSFNRNIVEWQKKPSFYNAKKIVLLHHHPVPVYRKEAAKGVLDREGFLLLENGATFMREMLKNGIKLIFHGHQHHRGIAKVHYPVGGDITSKIGIISAGSIGKMTDGENSFNIIDYYHNGKAEVNYFIARGEGTYDNNNENSILLFSYEEARLEYFHACQPLMLTTAKSTFTNYAISHKTGDLNIRTQYKGWRSTRESLNQINTSLYSKSGVFSEIPKYQDKDVAGHYQIEWVPQDLTDKGKQSGVIKFTPPLGTQPIDADAEVKIPNAIFFTKEDRLAVTQGKSELEFVSRIVEQIYPERLIMNVQFPPEFQMDTPPRIEAVNKQDESITLEETEYCSKYFHYFPSEKKAYFAIDYPLLGNKYKIVWGLPSEDNVKIDGISIGSLAKAKEIKTRLLNLTPEDSDSDTISSILKNISDSITQLISRSTKKTDNKLEVNILVYTKDIGSLIYVAHYCPDQIKPSYSDIWQWRVLNGYPVVGLAHKRKDVSFKLFPEKPVPPLAQYIRKPPCKGVEHLTAIVAIPLMYPFKSNNVVGILEIASCSRFSGLFSLDSSNKEGLATKLALQDPLERARFLTLCCGAIDIDLGEDLKAIEAE